MEQEPVMRKIIVAAEVSVDGCLGTDNVDFWRQVFQLQSKDVRGYLEHLVFTPDALLLGRKTYEAFAVIWPGRKGKDAERVNAMPKYVASRKQKGPLAWNATLIEGDVVEGIKKLKEAPGESLLQYGVGELTHTMLEHHLVDEIRLLVYPFAFGEGARMFDKAGLSALKLLDTKTFSSGAVALRYQPE